jgi:hypothetical protein
MPLGSLGLYGRSLDGLFGLSVESNTFDCIFCLPIYLCLDFAALTETYRGKRAAAFEASTTLEIYP